MLAVSSDSEVSLSPSFCKFNNQFGVFDEATDAAVVVMFLSLGVLVVKLNVYPPSEAFKVSLRESMTL